MLGGINVKAKTESEASVYCLTDGDEIQICAGAKTYETLTKGTTLTLRTKATGDIEDEGEVTFSINVKGASGAYALTGGSNGSLHWDGKEIERINAIGENYIRYESGLQICWGKTFVPSGLINTTVTLPVPYKDTSYTAHASYLDVMHTTVGATTESSSDTGFRVAVTDLIGKYDWDRYFVWSTIGRWK